MTDLKIIERDIKKLEKKYETKKAAVEKAAKAKSIAWRELKSKRSDLAREKRKKENEKVKSNTNKREEKKLKVHADKISSSEKYAETYNNIVKKVILFENDPEAKEVFKKKIYEIIEPKNYESDYSDFGDKNLDVLKNILTDREYKILFLRFNMFTFRELGIYCYVTQTRIRDIFSSAIKILKHPRVERHVMRGTPYSEWSYKGD